MENEVKNILSQFLKIDPSQVTSNSIIDKTAVGGSIMVHRLYASLANKGFKIEDYLAIKTVGQLLDRLNGQTTNPLSDSVVTDANIISDQHSIGVDIELIDNLPQAVDFRNNAFYANNFSPYEISYCLLKENPRASFAGLFAAKEAISKIDNRIGKKVFKQTEISHTSEGKPRYDEYSISIAHARDYAIAVAVYSPSNNANQLLTELSSQEKKLDAERVRQENSQIERRIKILTRAIVLLFIGLLTLAMFVIFLENK
jgi:phosphopantetheine--protein transferase-like protein